MAGHSPLFVRPEEALAVEVDEVPRCVGDPDSRLPGNLGKVRAHRRPIEELSLGFWFSCFIPSRDGLVFGFLIRVAPRIVRITVLIVRGHTDPR